ncbi:chemokine (C motif) receptor 1a, duplicate 1 [Cyprinodon tularosa]|uniref:Chemokine (C motif) receptor 1a, duplicate 1 n=1 Tax=Cyprinodon variegatus TaxID=28743 RepID=A0A3Q2CB21_CYPVA|nr:PREDICTED: chemokine XC receptor 1-like [Cyprinodon variegatus]XP_038126738.1 chemokine (C motif) receptor 1a, duplicate 1 [Cyprinodon tularosa]
MDDSSNITFDYDNDYEDEVCEKREVVKFGSIAIPIFFSIVFSLSLTGNILVLIILALYENLKSLTNIFIFNLAISDLVFTIGLPFWAIYHIWGWVFSEYVCKIVKFVFFTGFYSSVLFLTVMTIYRYLVVVYPLSGITTMKFWTGFFLSVLTWIISIGAAMPSLLQTAIVKIHHEESDSLGCEYKTVEWKIIGMSQQNVFFLAAFAVMAFCYIQILRRITRTRSHTKNRAVKLVFCIVAVFFVGWVPYNLVIFLRALSHKAHYPFNDCTVSIQLDYAFQVCRFIAFSHCCLNPVFYAFVGVKFRNHLKSLLHRMFRRPSPVKDQDANRLNLASRGSMY